MDALYAKYLHPAPESKGYSEEQIRIIMLISFYAVNRNFAAFNEYLASDLKPIFESNRELPIICAIHGESSIFYIFYV
jgi:hypothetical protein